MNLTFKSKSLARTQIAIERDEVGISRKLWLIKEEVQIKG